LISIEVESKIASITLLSAGKTNFPVWISDTASEMSAARGVSAIDPSRRTSPELATVGGYIAGRSVRLVGPILLNVDEKSTLTAGDFD